MQGTKAVGRKMRSYYELPAKVESLRPLTAAIICPSSPGLPLRLEKYLETLAAVERMKERNWIAPRIFRGSPLSAADVAI